MGEEIDDLVAKISARSDAYHALVGMAAGLKRKSENQIQECQSLIQVETALASAAEDVQAAIAAWQKG
jgi:FtsZ-binding cell division protein ZapB